MQISSLSPAHAGRRLLAAAALLIALACLPTAHAYAAEGPQYGSIGQYGEVTRFGGFDSTAYDNGAYDQPLTPGKFLNPVGFAVDPQDAEAGGTAVYVLDRVSDFAETTTQPGTEWRLQKLSDTGTPLGASEFYLPKSEASVKGVDDPVGVLGLAVDHSTGTIYTILWDTSGSGNQATPEAEEIIGWSTTIPSSGPNSGQLVAPPGSTTDTVSTPVSGYSAPAVFSDSSQLTATPLYDPQGLSLDVANSNSDLAVVADSDPRSSNGSEAGPAIVEQISPGSGAVTGSWSAESLGTVTNASSDDSTAAAAGIYTNADGSLNVLLSTAGARELDAVNLSTELTGPTVLASEEIDTPNEWARPLQTFEPELPPTGASAPVAELSNGLYASDYWLGSGYWNRAENEGIRLIDPANAGGALSSPQLPPTSVFDTLGNATSGDNCYLGDQGAGSSSNRIALAAGANGSVWILTSGTDSSFGPEPENEAGRQIIELSPSTTKPCVGPTETFTVVNMASGSPAAQPASVKTPLEVPVGSTVEFNASTIDYPTNVSTTQAAIYAYEWAPTGGAYTIVNDVANEHQPTSTASYQYTTPGVYNVELKLLGDFGEYDEDGTVIVQTASPPTATFKAPASAQTGQAVSFDASQSQPASGAQIADYHWSFGDGQTDDTQSATDSHVYTAPGTYTVTLTVRDNDNRVSTPVTQQITLSNPSPSNGGGGGGGTTTTSTTPTTPVSPPPVAVTDRSATNVDPQATGTAVNVAVTVTCPATKVTCAGTVQLKTAGAVAAIASSKASKAKKKVLTLGQKAFSLNGGQRETLTIKLSSAGQALLKKDRTLKIDVTVSAHDSYGDPLTKTLTLVLREPATKKSHSKR